MLEGNKNKKCSDIDTLLRNKASPPSNHRSTNSPLLSFQFPRLTASAMAVRMRVSGLDVVVREWIAALNDHVVSSRVGDVVCESLRVLGTAVIGVIQSVNS